MAKATVLKCDACGTWDSEDTPVRNVTVAGPRFDLCTKDRAFLLVHCGVDPDMAVKYQAMVDERIGVRGNMPALSAAEKWEPNQEATPEFEPMDSERTEEPPDDNASKPAEPAFVVVSSNPTAVDVITPEAQTEPVQTSARKGTRQK